MISKPAPDFSGTAVINGDFTEIKLSDYRGKYLVFFFYPLDFTFVCPTEILAFNDRVKEFRDIGAEVRKKEINLVEMSKRHIYVQAYAIPKL